MSPRASRVVSQSGKFRQQLQVLITALDATDLHYIR
jgi:myosin heavy subunit